MKYKQNAVLTIQPTVSAENIKICGIIVTSDTNGHNGQAFKQVNYSTLQERFL